jgi:predicted HAD superfamily phosphohydrolase
MSQDVFMKIMLTRFGGHGYGYILKYFVPRLRRHGVTNEQIETMMIANPARVFSRQITAVRTRRCEPVPPCAACRRHGPPRA